MTLININRIEGTELELNNTKHKVKRLIGSGGFVRAFSTASGKVLCFSYRCRMKEALLHVQGISPYIPEIKSLGKAEMVNYYDEKIVYDVYEMPFYPDCTYDDKTQGDREAKQVRSFYNKHIDNFRRERDDEGYKKVKAFIKFMRQHPSDILPGIVDAMEIMADATQIIDRPQKTNMQFDICGFNLATSPNFEHVILRDIFWAQEPKNPR